MNKHLLAMCCIATYGLSYFRGKRGGLFKEGFLGTLLIVVLAGLVFVHSASGVEVMRVKELYEKKYEFVDKQVVVEGTVDKVVDIATTDKLGNFLLKDSFGDTILVKAMNNPPSLGTNIMVEGTVIVTTTDDENIGGVFIHALNITVATQYLPPSNQKSPAKLTKGSLWLIVVIVGAALIAIIILIRLKTTDKPQLKHKDLTSSSKDIVTNRSNAGKGNVNRNAAIKPDVNGVTQQLLPGYFEVTAGLHKYIGKNIFIVTLHTRIGREEEGVDKSYGWIAFPQDCTTVSRYQADLRYEYGQYIIISRSRVNPTFVNNESMMENDAIVIKNNDRITFGEVELTFRGK
ncbi:membrane protein containing Forkhead-associated domain protein [Candidatus Magnetobacterium bavaricum]|uniref:Membrane protein containing Forkhead-associated domain protein n=1 Tax=Candidatus Magnetobacterium bavaricum TaxID=29290 RepID=A0A0F3GL43_9BACT|nr:membrane protein containing Forkhead-associated domain protein [Candidatus Magnetobacterium bavaricum]